MKTNREEMYRGGQPVTLWASSAIANGQMASGFDLTQLTLPYRAPFIVDTVKWTAYGPAQGAEAGNGWSGIGGLIRCRLSVGHIGLSNAWVPIWNYGPRLQYTTLANTNGQVTTVESTFGLVGAFTTSKAVPYSTYLWQPPVPIIVPPGACLVPSVQASNDTAFSGAVEIAYSGRQMPTDWRMPRQALYPYIGASIMAVPNTATTGGAVWSVDFDFKNPFAVDINVQRMTARTYYILNSVATEGLNKSALLYGWDTHHQRLIDGQPLDAAFSSLIRSAWTAPFTIPPNEGLQWEIVDTVLANGNNPTFYTLGLIGSRMEQIQ